MNADDTISMFKTAAWERAKGALREVAACAGQARHGSRHQNYDEIDERIETFIRTFADDGLHE